jgi:hypothetical protein
MAIAPFALASANGMVATSAWWPFGDPGIDLFFHLLHFFCSKGTGAVEVKPQAVEGHQGTRLGNVGIHQLFQGGLE